MKKFLTIVLILLIVIITAAVGFYFYLQSSRSPTYSGKINLEGITDEVEVYFTEYGVPHIYAQNEEDAYYAFGYIHAQDRLWQMDLLRHVGSGRLSELFGQDLIETDKYLRTMGVRDYAAKSSQEFIQRNHESLQLAQSYIYGINTFIENNPKPLEHLILGIEIEPFEIKNIFETLTYMGFSFSNAQMTDPVMTELYAKLDSSYLSDLQLYHYPDETVIRNYDDRYSELSKQTARALSSLGAPEFIGSNSWVLSGSKTESGRVILVNDPHIGFSQPSIWYEAHLHSSTSEFYGYHIAGVPFPLLIHNTSFANGLTMFENDDMDFYIEEIHPEDSNRYQHKGEWKDIQAVEQTINVKDGEPVTFSIRSTVHGPIVSDILMDEPLEDVVSMYWLTSDYSNSTIELLHQFTRVKKMEDMERSASMIHGPGLNLMYGDSSGNVAWWASAKLLKRRNEQQSKTFFDGSSGLDDPVETFPFEKNPHAINPPWGYVYSANNQPDTVDGVVYSGYYLPDDRGERITQILESQEKFSVDEMKAMTVDANSKMVESIKGIMLHSIKDIDDSELLSYLINWNSSFNADDFRPVIFTKWIYEILEAAQKDEMGDTLWQAYRGTHTFKVAIEHLVKNENSKWWDNVETDEVETRSQIILDAFHKSFAELREFWGEDYTLWKWSNTHQLTHNHAMGTALSLFNVGPFPTLGSNEVINNMGYSYSGNKELPIVFGPSTRRIIDFSDVRNNSWSILPTGQSGNYFSPYYDDQAEMFVKGEFRKMMMNNQEIKETGEKLLMQPKK
ncbi:MAG: penicillin acylase family protein [Bacteroidota bacterium]